MPTDGRSARNNHGLLTQHSTFSCFHQVLSPYVAVLCIVDPRHDALVDLLDHRHKLPHKSGGGLIWWARSAKHNGSGAEPPAGFRGLGNPGQGWSAKPSEAKSILSFRRANEVQICLFLLSCKLLKYTIWKNIGTFLLGVTLFFITLWQKVEGQA